MTTRSHGYRVGTRKSLKKRGRDKGRIKIKSFLQKFDVGDTVIVKAEPAYHKGMPFKRFFGKHGKVIEKRGKSYMIQVREGKKLKNVLCAPVHLKKA